MNSLHRVVLVVGPKNKSACLSHIPWHTIASTVMFYDLSLRSFRVRFFFVLFHFYWCRHRRFVAFYVAHHLHWNLILPLFLFMPCAWNDHTIFFHSFSFIYAFKICFHFTSDKSRGETLWGIRLVERFWVFHALVHVHQSALPTFCEQFSSAYYEMSK